LFLYWLVSRAFRSAVSGSPNSSAIRKITAMPACAGSRAGLVHLPQQSGGAGEFGAFGRDLGMRVNFSKW
jgi:hypothetical protein